MIPMFKTLIEAEEINAAKEALEMGWLGMGSYVSKFEEEVASYLELENRFVAAVSTATAALHIALILADVGADDEVIVSSFNCSADFQAITWTGANIVFCDCDEETLELDLEKAKLLVTERTKAIIVMDYDCIISNHEKIAKFASTYNIRVIHDASHSFGSLYKGKKVGSFSDICVFSHDPVKTVTCLDGGTIVVKTKEELKKIHELRLLGMQQPAEVMYQNKRAWTFDVERVGYRYHMLNLHAAIGLSQLKKINFIKKTRQDASKLYSKLLAKVEFVKVPNSNFEDVNPFLYYIRVPEEFRDKLRDFLKNKGIDTGIHWQPGHWFSLWKNCKSGDLSVTDKVGKQILSLPLHSGMNLDFVITISNEIANFFKLNKDE